MVPVAAEILARSLEVGQQERRLGQVDLLLGQAAQATQLGLRVAGDARIFTSNVGAQVSSSGSGSLTLT